MLLAELLRLSDAPAACLPHLQAASRCAPTAALRKQYALRLYFALVDTGRSHAAGKVAAALAAQAEASAAAHDAALLCALRGAPLASTADATSAASTASVAGIAAACTAAAAADEPGELVVMSLREGRICGLDQLAHKAKLARLLKTNGLDRLAPTTHLGVGAVGPGAVPRREADGPSDRRGERV